MCPIATFFLRRRGVRTLKLATSIVHMTVQQLGNRPKASPLHGAKVIKQSSLLFLMNAWVCAVPCSNMHCISDHEILLLVLPACTHLHHRGPCSLINYIHCVLQACMVRHAHQSYRASSSYSCCSLDLLFSTALHCIASRTLACLDYLA